MRTIFNTLYLPDYVFNIVAHCRDYIICRPIAMIAICFINGVSNSANLRKMIFARMTCSQYLLQALQTLDTVKFDRFSSDTPSRYL